MSSYASDQNASPSSWAITGSIFAACALTVVGAFQIIAGLTAILNDDFFVVAPHYTFDLDVSAWGWIHLVLGVLVLAAGIGLFGRRAWAGVTAVVLVSLSAIANFFFIPYHPTWAIVMIAIDIWILWSLTRPNVIQA